MTAAVTRPQFFWKAFSDQARHTATAARHLIELLETRDQREQLAQTIKRLELLGTEIARGTIRALHSTDITPIDRDEIHGLIVRQVDLMNELESVSDRVVIYAITEVREEAVELAMLVASCADKILDATTMLTQAENAVPLTERCRAIAADEQQADRLLRRALARLFRETRDPVEVIKWRDIFESLETTTDRADDVANTIESIVLDRF